MPSVTAKNVFVLNSDIINSLRDPSLCRDFKFWENRFCGKTTKLSRCQGNSPGQSFELNYNQNDCSKILNYQYFVDNSVCDDKSDLHCSMHDGTVSCEGELLWPCKDKSFCLPHDHVCDGFIQCRDESDEDQKM